MQHKIVAYDRNAARFVLIEGFLRRDRRKRHFHDGVRQNKVVPFGHVRVLRRVENHVDLPVFECLKLLLLRIEPLQKEAQRLFAQAVLRINDVVRDDAGQLAGNARLEVAVTDVVNQPADADVAVLCEPVLFRAVEDGGRSRAEVALVQLVRVERHIVRHLAHGVVEFFFQAGAIGVDREINIRPADLRDGGHTGRRPLRRFAVDNAVDFVPLRESESLLHAVNLNMLRPDAVGLLPLDELLALHTAL